MGFFLLILGGVVGAILTWLYLDSAGKRQSDQNASAATDASTSGNEPEVARLSQQVSEHAAARQGLEAELQSLKRVREENEALRLELAEQQAGEPNLDNLPVLATPTDAPPDDLTEIKGVGKVLSGKLNKLGFTTYQQIAELTPEQITRVDEVLDFKGRIEREEWIEQAKRLTAEKSG
ncbi:MAG: hypothetical protein AAFY56_09760 [Pseudomonadota bacterium]